jgi:hypothetical protein
MPVFSPGGQVGNVSYIDDVSVKWYPNLRYTPRSVNTYLYDNFESHSVDDTIHNTILDTGGNWAVSNTSDMSGFFVENSLSFGAGYKSLATTCFSSGTDVYSNANSKLRLNPSYIVTVDLDVYLQNGYSTSFGLVESLTGPYAAWLGVVSNKWKYYNGSIWVDTDVSVAYDTWTHIQLALNCAARNYKVVIQKTGELPVLAATAPWDPGTLQNDLVFFNITPSGSVGQIVYFDNITVMYGPPNVCGDENHPYPVSDLTLDCHVNFKDLAILMEHWLEDTMQ